MPFIGPALKTEIRSNIARGVGRAHCSPWAKETSNTKKLQVNYIPSKTQLLFSIPIMFQQEYYLKPGT